MSGGPADLKRALVLTLALTCSLLLVGAGWNLLALSQSLSHQERLLAGQVEAYGGSLEAGLEGSGYAMAPELFARPGAPSQQAPVSLQQVALKLGEFVIWARPPHATPRVSEPPKGRAAVQRSGRLWVYAHRLDDGRLFLAAYESPSFTRLRRQYILLALFETSAVAVLLLFWGLLALKFYRSYSGISDSLKEAGEFVPGAPAASSAQAVAAVFKETVAELRSRTRELEELHLKEKRRAEEVEGVAEALCSNLEAGYLRFDAEGCLSGMNREARQLLGLVEVPRMGDRAEALLRGRPSLVGLLERAKEGRSLLTLEEVVGAEGVSLQAVALPIYNAYHQMRGHLLILKDRSREYDMARTLREREALTRLGEMSAGVAHEVRNALGSVLACLRLLREDHVELGTDAHFQAIGGEVRGLEKMVQNLLYYARPLPLERREVSAPALVEDVAGQIRDTFPMVAVESSAREGVFLADPESLARCLLNLARNAAEATLAARSDGGRVALGAEVAEEGIIFTVDDNGSGLPQDPSALFAPFASHKPGGTGLGLATARKIAREHGGDVTAIPKGPLGGARFIVEIGSPGGRLPSAGEGAP